MGEMMNFPETPEEFIEFFEFADKDEVYTNGSRLIPSFRVKQMMDHYMAKAKKTDEELKKLQTRIRIMDSQLIVSKAPLYDSNTREGFENYVRMVVAKDIAELLMKDKAVRLQQSEIIETQEYALLNGLKTLSTTYTVATSTTEDFSEEVEFQADQELFTEINEQILESLETDTTFEYSGRPQAKQAPVFVNGHKSYKRDKKKSVNALKKAKHKCEIDGTHPSFVRRNSSQNYTEPHHLVPMGFSDRFAVSLDVEENIVSLCSNCHNQLHYGRDVRHLLDTLFALRKDLLKSAGIEITIEELYEMYDA